MPRAAEEFFQRRLLLHVPIIVACACGTARDVRTAQTPHTDGHEDLHSGGTRRPHGGFAFAVLRHFFAGPHAAWALKVSASHHHPRTACEHAPRSPRELVYALVPASKSACVELSQSLCARALAFASFEPMPSAWQILPCGLHGGMRGPRQVATAGRMTIRPNMPERRRQWPPGPSA